MNILPVLVFLFQCNFSDEDTSPRNPQEEYTKDSPGEWKDLKEMHLPRVSIAAKSIASEKIIVNVPLENPSDIHYIEVIGVMDDKKKILASKKFTPDQKAFTAEFPVQSSWNLKYVKVYAKCSLHDTWTVGEIETLR